MIEVDEQVDVSDSVAYTAGLNEYLLADGGCAAMCPYIPNSRASQMWFEGWADGQHAVNNLATASDDWD